MKNLEILKKLIDTAGDFIVILDEKFQPIYANKTVLESLEIDTDVLYKFGLQHFVHPDDALTLKAFRTKLMNAPEFPVTEKIRYISKSGKVLQYETNCVFDKSTNSILVINRNLESIVGQEGAYGSAKKLANIGGWEYQVESSELAWDEITYDIYELNTKKEIDINRMMQFFRKDSQELFREAFTKLIDNGTPLDLELNFISGKFKPATARFTGKLISGKTRKVVGTIQDLTDIRRLELKSKDYKEAVDASSIVSITDREGVISEVNNKFCEISGYSRKELIGKSHRVVNSKFHSVDFWEELWKTICDGQVWTGEIKNKTKSGTSYWVSTTIIPFKNSQGQTYQYLSIQTDITENKKMTEELMVSEKLSSIGEISAQILHEVMTPLSIISLSIENLEEDIEELDIEKAKSSPLKASLTEIMSNYDKIEEIFDNMRSLLVQKSGADTKEISVKETFFKALSLVKAKLTSKDIELKTEKFNDYKITCSTSELSQVFINLINNACDAVANLEQRWIEVSTTEEDGIIVMTISDSGEGIPEDIRERIFDNLFTTKGDSKGTGLGMGVCKKLVKRNSGEIRVAPEFPNTTFELKFPLS